MASTYELAEPEAPEADASEPDRPADDTTPRVVLLPVGEAVGACDLNGECR